MDSLDFSEDKTNGGENVGSHDLQSLVDKTSLGSRTSDGMYEVRDWEFASKAKRASQDADDDETDDVIARALRGSGLGSDEGKEKKEEKAAGSLGALGSMFARLTGSKTLTDADLKPVLEAMKQHLMKKNVAKDIAEKVCEGVGEGLIGQKVGGFQSEFSGRIVTPYANRRYSHKRCRPPRVVDYPHPDSHT